MCNSVEIVNPVTTSLILTADARRGTEHRVAAEFFVVCVEKRVLGGVKRISYRVRI